MVRQGPTQSELDRLTAELRVFDANGIERAAWAWDRHERGGFDRPPLDVCRPAARQPPRTSLDRCSPVGLSKYFDACAATHSRRGPTDGFLVILAAILCVSPQRSEEERNATHQIDPDAAGACHRAGIRVGR